MGVECRKPLSADPVAAIHTGMAEYAVLVFRDQSPTDEQHRRFRAHLSAFQETRGGTPGNIHFRTDRAVRRLGLGIRDFSNVGRGGEPLSTVGLACAFKLGDQLWHSDSSFNAIGASDSVLSARSVSSRGGNTAFVDIRAAHAPRDDGIKVEIEDLVCLHCCARKTVRNRAHSQQGTECDQD